MADIVLVHGTTQSATGFWRLVDALQRRGHRAFTVDVPGTRAFSAEYAELLPAQLPPDLDRPLLAAHSAAGLLLPALAARLNAVRQVWLAAAVVDYAGGRCLLDEIRADPTAVFHDEWLGVDPTTDPVLARYFLFHDTDLATLRRALSTVSRCDLSTVYPEVPRIDPAVRPSAYLLPAEDRALTRAAMYRTARERLHIDPVEVPSGHSNYVAHPEPIAKAITRAIGLSDGS